MDPNDPLAPLTIVMKHYSMSPNIQSINGMHTLASTNKDLWNVWKESLPIMTDKLPKRGHSAMFSINAMFNKVNIDFIEADLIMNIGSGMTNRIMLDSWGEKAISFLQYTKLTEEEKRAIGKKMRVDRYKRTIERMLERIQIGDMCYIGSYDICYALVDKPSSKEECVVRVPSILVNMSMSEDLHVFVYLLPVECTNYMLKHDIIPITSDKPLVVPVIKEAPIEIPGMPELSIVEHKELPFYKYCAEAIKEPMLRIEHTVYSDTFQIIMYQHPDNESLFFDTCERLFHVQAPIKFTEVLPNQIKE